MSEKNFAGYSKRREEEARDRARRRRTTRTASIIAAVVIIIAAAAFFVNSDYLRGHTTAYEVDGVKFSAADYKLLYSETVNYYYQWYIYLGADSGSAPDFSQNNWSAQIFDSSTGQTWGEYFAESARSSLIEIGTLVRLAEQDGFTLSDEDKAQIQASLDETLESYKKSGYKSFAVYAKSAGAHGMTDAAYIRLNELRELAARYSEWKSAAFAYTPEQLTAHYEKNADTLDYFTYRAILVKPEPVNEEDYADDANGLANAKLEAMTAAEEKASAYGERISALPRDEREAEFIKVAKEYDSALYAADASTKSEVLGSALPSVAKDWFYEQVRSCGCILVKRDSDDADAATGFYVYLYVERSSNDYSARNFRQLVVAPAAVDTSESIYVNEDGTPNEAAIETQEKANALEAQSKAERIYEEWAEAGFTEDALAGLIKEEDASGAAADGIHDDIPKQSTSFDKEVMDWLYSDERKPGDHINIHGDGGEWYILCFRGVGRTYADVLADNELRAADVTAWQEGYRADAKITAGWGSRFV
ncbi:MAG: hypothetical protein LBC78_02030 [Oscillospiraceae bacterium]|jgi:hypothetical protein|nr:hypothetical protein [Oscillospiraceae bacterium]